MKRSLAGWILVFVLLGTGAACRGAAPQQGLRILPPRLVGLDPEVGGRFVTGLGKSLLTWGIPQAPTDPGLVLAAVLAAGEGGRLRLEATLRQGEGGPSLFSKVYSAPGVLFERMLASLANDLSIRVNGRATPALSRFLVVKELRPGVTEIWLTDSAGSRLDQLTRHASLTRSPTGVRRGRFAYVTYVAGPPQLWGMDLRDRRPRRLYAPGESAGLAGSPALSPDGGTVAFIESDRRGRQSIRLLDWDTGRTWALTDFADDLAQPAWSRDGERIACAHGSFRRDHLTVISRLGTVMQDIRLPYRSVQDPSWSPNGSTLIFAAEAEEGGTRLVSLDLPSGRVKEWYSSPGPLAGPRWGPGGTWLTFDVAGRGTNLLDVSTGSVRPFLDAIASHRAVRWVW